jgi:hypothetical protein
MLGALAEANKGDVRPFPRRHCSDVLNLDLARDHLVPESGDDRGRRAPSDPRARSRSARADARSRDSSVARPLLSSVAPAVGLPNWRPTLAACGCYGSGGPALTPGGQSLPAPTLGRHGASPGWSARNRKRQEPPVLLFAEPLDRSVPLHVREETPCSAPAGWIERPRHSARHGRRIPRGPCWPNVDCRERR